MKTLFLMIAVAASLAIGSCSGSDSGSDALQGMIGNKVLVTTSEPVAITSMETATRFDGKLLASDAAGILVEVDGGTIWVKIDVVISVVDAAK